MSIDFITAWSISRLLEFEACAYRSFLHIIRKASTPDYDDKHPMIRGQIIHTEVEEYIIGKTELLPASGKRLHADLEFCKEMYTAGLATAEEQLGLDKNWNKTGWFDDNVWLRVAMDCWIQLDKTQGIIYDWKTGKSFGNEVKYMQQMQLYAVVAFMLHPELEVVDVILGFLDDGTRRTKVFTRGKKITMLVARFTERALKMTTCIDFRPKPNIVNCKYCPFGPQGTNLCIYGVEPL